MESKTEKKPSSMVKTGKNWSKEVKLDKFCYHKVGRVIAKLGAIEKNKQFKVNPKLIHILEAPIIYLPTVY